MGDSACNSRNISNDEVTNNGGLGASRTPGNTRRPSIGRIPSTNTSHTTLRADLSAAQSSLEEVIEVPSEVAVQRRTSRLRKLTNALPRLRRTGTGDTSSGIDDASGSNDHAATSSLTSPDELAGESGLELPTDEAVEAYLRRNAHNGERVRALMERMAKRLPTQVEDEHELQDGRALKADEMPTTLRAAIRMFPEVKVLVSEHQEMVVAVEVEGVLHNRTTAPNVTVDVVFIVDNGYYVTKDCLERATDAVSGALYHLRRGDRLALYTTHCAHNLVSGNKPELHCPIRPLSADTEELFADLTANICRCGTQVWDPARPNPSMTDVVLAVANSLDGHDLKQGRTHIILLSPATYVLHDVSKSFPDLYIHRINPAVLPYRRDPELQNTICSDSCCKNVFVSNCVSYQSVPSRVKRILKNARSKAPVGELSDLSIDIRMRAGCELIEDSGSREVSQLRLGQVHTFFVRVRVDRNKAQRIDLDSVNPVFNSSLDVKALRQECQNAVAVGATKLHILDVQLYHRNSINAVDCWNYTEAPLTLIGEMGGLAPPVDAAMEVFKRHYFHKLSQLATGEARAEAESSLAAMEGQDEKARTVLEHMAKEIRCHEAIRKYELDHRQKLPLCPGPIDIEASHEWLLDLWNKKKNKRNGFADVRGGTAGLTNGFSGLTL